jgi:hypothetical protein
MRTTLYAIGTPHVHFLEALVCYNCSSPPRFLTLSYNTAVSTHLLECMLRLECVQQPPTHPRHTSSP